MRTPVGTASLAISIHCARSLTSVRADNPLQTAVLNLFVSVKSRFPNLVVGAITRDSVRKALLSGITADQVRVGLHLFQVFSCSGAVPNDAVSLATLRPPDERDRGVSVCKY